MIAPRSIPRKGNTGKASPVGEAGMTMKPVFYDLMHEPLLLADHFSTERKESNSLFSPSGIFSSTFFRSFQ